MCFYSGFNLLFVFLFCFAPGTNCESPSSYRNRSYSGNKAFSGMEAVEVGALSLLMQQPQHAPAGVRGHPYEPLLFLPIAVTHFSSSSSSFSNYGTSGDAPPSTPSVSQGGEAHLSGSNNNSSSSGEVGSGWVLVVSFASLTQRETFLATSTAQSQSPSQSQAPSPRTSQHAHKTQRHQRGKSWSLKSLSPPCRRRSGCARVCGAG